MQKTQREAEKYEFARQLNKNYKRISSIYMRDLSRKDAFMQQCAIAIYFIDKVLPAIQSNVSSLMIL